MIINHLYLLKVCVKPKPDEYGILIARNLDSRVREIWHLSWPQQLRLL